MNGLDLPIFFMDFLKIGGTRTSVKIYLRQWRIKKNKKKIDFNSFGYSKIGDKGVAIR
ncbi:MAG: hypothetical protein LBD35_05190 [Prevotellaceae bacterium]|jgi:hypothetical protein|nr:hypothetical protein [Prevotellaceae bacterium]